MTYPLPEIADILEETLGILVYQEQVMRIASRRRGLLARRGGPAAQGDRQEEARDHGRRRARSSSERAVEHGTPKKKAKELWSLIEPFARYGFNKSHAVAYALVAYKTACLKAHYPVDFLAATLSAEIGSTDGIVKVIGDCVEMGIPVLPPDINESRKASPAVGEAIRFGLAAIKGVGEAAAQAILDERAKGPFASFTDFALRLDSRLVNKRTLDALIAAGAFDSLGKNRATLAAASERVVARAARRREDEELGQSSLFGEAAAEDGPPADDFPDLPEWSLDERLKGEKEVLGFYVTGHPLDAASRRRSPASPTRRSRSCRRGWTRRARSAGVLDEPEAAEDQEGRERGQDDAEGDARGHDRQRAGLRSSRASTRRSAAGCATDLPVLVTGKVRESGAAIEMTVQDDRRRSRASTSAARERSRSASTSRFADERVLARLQEQPASRIPGTTPVSIRLVRPGEFEATLQGGRLDAHRALAAADERDPRPGRGGLRRVRL